MIIIQLYYIYILLIIIKFINYELYKTTKSLKPGTWTGTETQETLTKTKQKKFKNLIDTQTQFQNLQSIYTHTPAA